MQKNLRRLALVGLVVMTSLAVAAPAAAQQLPQQPLSVQFAEYVATQPLDLHFARQQSQQMQPQGESDPGIGFGVSAGITQTKFTADIPDFFGSRTGYSLGIWFGGNRDGRAGVMGELNYVEKGGSRDVGDDVTIQYIQIPVLVRINAGSASRNSAVGYAVFGPSVNIKVSASGSLNVVGDYHGFDLGVVAGAGFEVTRIGVEVRGDWGLLSVFDPSEGADSIRTFTLQALLKLRIN
jgi:hypothetical protein